MRAFIAIELPEEIRDELRRRQQAFHAICPRSAVCRDARWTRPEGIHLTLKFLGEISEDTSQRVIEALDGLGTVKKFQVEVRGFGFFPDARRPRVFWAGVSASPALN